MDRLDTGVDVHGGQLNRLGIVDQLLTI